VGEVLARFATSAPSSRWPMRPRPGGGLRPLGNHITMVPGWHADRLQRWWDQLIA